MTEANRVVLLSVSGTMTWIDSSSGTSQKNNEIRQNSEGENSSRRDGESDQTG